MKNQIIKVMEEYNFKLGIDEDGGLIFEGAMINRTTLDQLSEKLFAISKDLDVILFQADADTLMIAVFYNMPMV